ncbi:hypothetical protein GOV08_03395 [Candidatus Woesearchaeota archaeon]|nr:hypothetical protein [Candidatus Woesearchaeota archaeon]
MVVIPDSMDEVIYFTNREIGDGNAKAWVYKALCPKCKKGKMGKPVKDGKVKIRAKEYVCPECGFTEEKKEHEGKLMMEIVYTCPHCSHKGEAKTEFKRKTFEGVSSYVFECRGCNKKLAITKKMKAPKKK